jgi:hypothetical protein
VGFNTVAFLLNDYMHTLEKSPKTVTWLLSHPVMSKEDKAYLGRHDLRIDDEPVVHGQALEVLPTFHADEQKFFVAGGNCISDLKCVRFGVSKEGKKTVTLELPDWFEPRRFMPNKPKNWPKKK